MEHWYAFRAWNAQAHFGYGTEAEADRYVDHLNASRTVNHYAADRLNADQVAHLGLEDSDLGFSLSIALADIDEAADQ